MDSENLADGMACPAVLADRSAAKVRRKWCHEAATQRPLRVTVMPWVVGNLLSQGLYVALERWSSATACWTGMGSMLASGSSVSFFRDLRAKLDLPVRGGGR